MFKNSSYGKYFVLVSGPFANLSSDFNPLVDFVARERPLHTIECRDFKPDVILSMQKRALIRRIGLFVCRGWVQHILDRWRDVVSGSSGSLPSAPPPQTILISFLYLAILPLISFTAVLSAALMCLVLRHLELFSLY